MDTGKKETTEFVDTCVCCGHDINSTTNIDGDKHAACEYSLPLGFEGTPMEREHSVCTYGGCMPDLEYRHDNKPR